MDELTDMELGRRLREIRDTVGGVGPLAQIDELISIIFLLAAQRLQLSLPHRGDATEAWLERWRATFGDYRGADTAEGAHAWRAATKMLDDFRAHADAHVPLSEEVARG